MQLKHALILLPILCSVLFFSCKRKNDKPVVLISPYELIQSGNPGDVKAYQIKVESEVALSHFRVFLKLENEYEVLYKDSVLSTKNFAWNFEYKIPQAAAGRTIYFRFSAVDRDGSEGLGVKQIVAGDKPLTENQGVQLFTFANIAKNALNLETLTLESSLSDSSLRDLQEYVTDSAATDAPTYRWASPAGGKFAKSNTFNYGNATVLTAKQVYGGNIQISPTDSISAGDIFITKTGSATDEKYVVIQVVSINDNPGSNLDSYTLNIKH